MELFRGLFLIDFIYTAGSGGFGESLFEEKIFSEAVGDFDNIAFFAAALYVYFQNYLHIFVLLLHDNLFKIYFTGNLRKSQ